MNEKCARCGCPGEDKSQMAQQSWFVAVSQNDGVELRLCWNCAVAMIQRLVELTPITKGENEDD